jgi:hypothetical protein
MDFQEDDAREQIESRYRPRSKTRDDADARNPSSCMRPSLAHWMSLLGMAEIIRRRSRERLKEWSVIR